MPRKKGTKQQDDEEIQKLARYLVAKAKVERAKLEETNGSTFEVWDGHVLEITDSEIIVRLDL